MHAQTRHKRQQVHFSVARLKNGRAGLHSSRVQPRSQEKCQPSLVRPHLGLGGADHSSFLFPQHQGWHLSCERGCTRGDLTAGSTFSSGIQGVLLAVCLIQQGPPSHLAHRVFYWPCVSYSRVQLLIWHHTCVGCSSTWLGRRCCRRSVWIGPSRSRTLALVCLAWSPPSAFSSCRVNAVRECSRIVLNCAYSNRDIVASARGIIDRLALSSSCLALSLVVSH